VAQAINAGDMLLMLPYLAISEAPARVAGELSRVMAEHALRTARGQICELDLLPSERVGWDDYMTAIEGKTGSLLALPVHGAAVLAGRNYADAEALCNGFMPIGALFQLQDDLLDLYGDKGRDCIASDLYEGKISAPVVAHMARRPRDREWLLSLLRTPREQTDPRDVEKARGAFLASGAVDDVLDAIRSLSARPMRDAALRGEPALRALAQAVSQQATLPIRHLFPESLGVVA
jgi:geranylgeranyl diphosphate synthase type I